jgi:apolipoprotein N-acyltransferase
VLRSANTGISCFIDPAGFIHQPQNWWKASSAKMRIEAKKGHTFFVRMGDVLSKAAMLLSAFLLLFSFYQRFTRRKKTERSSLS